MTLAIRAISPVRDANNKVLDAGTMITTVKVKVEVNTVQAKIPPTAPQAVKPAVD
jgi:hypothetical protein